MDDSRVCDGNRRHITTEIEMGTDFKRPVDSSKGGDENIQDSVFDAQMHLPSTFRGERKILDNQNSISIISYNNEDHVKVTDQREQNHTKRHSKQTVKHQQNQHESKIKQTTIKKLTENQTNLLTKCSGILSEVNDGLTKCETGLAKIAAEYTQGLKDAQQIEYQVETLVVKYAMTKESALAELYNLTA